MDKTDGRPIQPPKFPAALIGSASRARRLIAFPVDQWWGGAFSRSIREHSLPIFRADGMCEETQRLEGLWRYSNRTIRLFVCFVSFCTFAVFYMIDNPSNRVKPVLPTKHSIIISQTTLGRRPGSRSELSFDPSLPLFLAAWLFPPAAGPIIRPSCFSNSL